MEAYRIDRFGSVDGIVLRSSENPRPGPKEILMRVRASSLNYRDLMVLKAGGRGPTKLGIVPRSDGAGEEPTSIAPGCDAFGQVLLRSGVRRHVPPVSFRPAAASLEPQFERGARCLRCRCWA